MANTPLELADIMALNRENRANTLNKRINYKGNNETMVTGGRALDNQSQLWDRNNVANTMTIADPNGVGADWTLDSIKKDIEGLNNRYEGRNEQNIQFAPATKRGRRLNEIAHNQMLANKGTMIPRETIEQIKKYEGIK